MHGLPCKTQSAHVDAVVSPSMAASMAVSTATYVAQGQLD